MTQQSNTVNFLIQDANGKQQKFSLLSVQWGENVEHELDLAFLYLLCSVFLIKSIALSSENVLRYNVSNFPRMIRKSVAQRLY